MLATMSYTDVQSLVLDTKRHTVRFSGDANTIPYHANSINDGKKKVAVVQLGPEHDTLIEQHVDRRIQLFFQQLILVHKTPFIYEAAEAQDQYGAGSRKGKTQAAHSSTNPCLYAYFKKADGTKDPERKFVYMRHSHSYVQDNATVDLPKIVNETDSLIDFQCAEAARLRPIAMRIINQCARGLVNPVEGTKRMLRAFSDQLSVHIEARTEGEKLGVLSAYKQHVDQVLEDVEDSERVFDLLIGVHLPATEKEALIRKVVFARRYKLIQEAQYIESQIVRRIIKAQGDLGIHAKKSLRNVDDRIRYRLLSETTGALRRNLEKLFCTSLEQLQQAKDKQAHLRKISGRDVKLFDTAAKEQIVHQLKRDLRHMFYEMNRAEELYRSELFKGLRTEVNSDTQEEFATRFKQQYPTTPMSRSTVSRLENRARGTTNVVYATPLSQREKIVDLPLAQKIANTFGVATGLFLPALISSEY